MQLSQRLQWYKRKYKNNSSKDAFSEFIKNETPVHTWFLEKGICIDFYPDTKADWIMNSFSVCISLKDAKRQIVQFTEVRFYFGYNRLIFGKKVKQWLPKAISYICDPTGNFFKPTNATPFFNESELIDLIERFFDEYPIFDLRLPLKCEYFLIEEEFLEEPSFLYLIKDNDKGVIKIGRASNPRQRYFQIDSDTASSITLAATIKSIHAKVLDRLMQNHFAYKRFKKEWYSLSENDIKRILKGQLPYPMKELLGEVTIYP
ncbi:GIY-YIG nuclease family protein [Cohnella sp. GCM10020058]|uniref:GIY-YIG nuclease family protein n=1 Tax=Cohnella sp. GCM10020058 TaxID=3317330 RepID=UPI0036381C4D